MPGRVPLDATVVATERQLSTTLSGEVIILGLDDSMYYGLSATGARIWELVQVRRTVDEILATVISEFDVERDRAAADLDALLAELQSRGLIAITGSPVDR
jgi:hypothetical protein